MVSINLGVAVPLDEYEEIHRLLNQIRINYKVHNGKRCSKGKALVFAVKNGYKEVIRILEEQDKINKERLKNLKKGKLTTHVVEERTDGI